MSTLGIVLSCIGVFFLVVAEMQLIKYNRSKISILITGMVFYVSGFVLIWIYKKPL